MTGPSTSSLVASVSEVAEALGVSDDLVYELVARGELPSLKLGRRRLIPRRAVELIIERSLQTFDADALSTCLWRHQSRIDK